MPKEIKDMVFEELVAEFQKALRDYNLAYFNCMNDIARIDEVKARADKLKAEILNRYSHIVRALEMEERKNTNGIVYG